MEDARIRAFSRSLGSNFRTLSLPLLIGAALYAMTPSAHAANCQAGSSPGGDGTLTTGADTCVITGASDQTTSVDASDDTDLLQLDGTGGSFSFDTSTIGSVFTNFEDAEVLGDVTVTGSGADPLDWTVTSGTLTVGDSDALATATSVTVESGATMTTTAAGALYTTGALTNHGFVYGNLTVTGDVVNDGHISPGLGAGDFGLVTINGNYVTTATPGNFDMDVDLTTGTADQIQFNGNVSGGTYINVTQANAVDAGVATTGNGILLASATGTVGTYAYGLGAPVVSGPYQYVLQQVSLSATENNLYLQSQLREEFYGHDALLASGQAIIRSCFRSDQRIPDSPRARENVRAWGSAGGASFTTGADAGVSLDDQMYCANGGIDFGAGEGMRFGVIGGYGSSRVGVSTPGGQGKLYGDTEALEAVLSIGTPMYFLNVTGGYATSAWTFDGPVQPSKDATQSGFIASAQAGATVNVTPFRFKFMGEANYDNTSCGNDCLLAGMTEDTGSVVAKGTIRIEAMTHQINPYVAVSYADDLSSGSTVSYMGESLKIDAAHSLLSLNAGFNAPIDSGVTLFGDFSVLDGMGNDTSGYTAFGGLKAYW
ncbi:MAG: hypothetical protein GC190_16205 [Alphaproteobacteria bacterium]|nr:hypothetical protein [Alphaproteobacteria bacterium]